MDPIVVISIFAVVIVLFLVIGAPLKPIRFIGQAFVKLAIGALMLFLLNAVGASFDLKIPINAITTIISGFLGIPGVAALIIIKYVIM
ncbi:pro-sigmaK processing inhibitor BofA family protein [Tuberibacillus calidus]|jgi:inhibitor of the pro-sigma K processing machinery|uniref:pro-sigmaK processing inhibitor BofA family protein n=1 Tax=Tuberibacillus calidus TaxID=340097 RepID=UPI00041CECF0|nr:pro-sigmaK processing inhibitor BofA family protein [Tuberibacillus calidus]